MEVDRVPADVDPDAAEDDSSEECELLWCRSVEGRKVRRGVGDVGIEPAKVLFAREFEGHLVESCCVLDEGSWGI